MGDLAFDTLQRFAAIRSALAESRLPFEEPGPEGYHLLDVGGFPGSLADYLAPDIAALTLDRPECDRPDYRRGTGADLPFEDGAFPAVVASDTLEHVPPAERVRFLSEMARASSRFVLLAGPLRGDLAERAEIGVSNLYEHCHGESHRWLSEHRAYGLPEASMIAGVFAPLGSVRVLGNGWLPNWTLMMGLSFLDDHFAAAPPGSSNPGTSLSDAYEELRGKYGPDDSEPAYRQLVLLDKAAGPMSVDEALATFPASVRGEPDPPEVRFCLELALAHLNGLAERFAPRLELGEEGLERGYAEQLERALRLAERDAGKKRKPSAGKRPEPSPGLARRALRKLFGRG